MLDNGEYGIAGLYFVSSASGILGFWALYAMSSSASASATILGLALSWWVGIFALVMFGATLAIGFFVDTDIQEWIGKSYFGNYPEDVRYVSLDDEQENFDKLKESV